MGESLAIVQQPAGQPSAQMMRMYKAMGQDIPTSKKTLIINPTNPLVQSYISQYESTPDSEKVRTFVSYIYDQACLLE
jgi:molecular chaperone HtpG